MSRITYLGQKWTGPRKSPQPGSPPHETPSKGRRIPAMSIADPNAEPFVASFALESPSVLFESVRSITLVIIPADDPIPSDAAGWLAANTPRTKRASLDVTGKEGSSVVLTVAGLPDGDFIAQSVIEAGDD